MNRFNRMWQRAFDQKFNELIAEGVSKDAAFNLAEAFATDGLDRYVDDELEERKLGER